MAASCGPRSTSISEDDPRSFQAAAVDPDAQHDIYTYEEAYQGTNLLAKRHKTGSSRSRSWTDEVVFEQTGVTRLRDLQLNQV